MYSQKKTKRLIAQFKRDNDLGTPFHKSGAMNTQRAEFIKKLMQSFDFVKTTKQNDERFALSFKEAFKRLGKFDLFIALVMTTVVGIVGYEYSHEKSNIKNVKQVSGIDKSVLYFTLLSTLIGLLLGLCTVTALAKENYELNVDKFYNRLSVRLFDVMREDFNDLDENILKHCNPEMANVITALMVANMPENDTKEIRNIANKVSKILLNDVNPEKKAITLSSCNREITSALSIIEHNLITNRQLHDAILGVYRGNIPATFVLNQANQKTI